MFRALDENWDWRFGKGKQDYVNKTLEIAYDIKTRILEWVGDCFFNAGAGIDWKNRLSRKNQKEYLDNDIKKMVVMTEGVLEITYFDSSIVNRAYRCQVNYKDIYGQTVEIKI